jgi:hypothetical protein
MTKLLSSIFFTIFCSLVFIRCENKRTSEIESQNQIVDSIPIDNNASKFDCNVAIEFINEYNSKVMISMPGMDRDSFLRNSNVASVKLINAYHKLVVEAEKKDPEMGLDQDPFLEAQDGYETGFEIENCNKETGEVIVKSRENQEYKLRLKLEIENKKTKVTGCGSVNIIEDR